MNLNYSGEFLKAFGKLTKEIQEAYQSREQIFKDKPFHPILRTHKIRELDCWAFLVTYKIRVTFRFRNGDIFLMNIGDHSIYRKK